MGEHAHPWALPRFRRAQHAELISVEARRDAHRACALSQLVRPPLQPPRDDDLAQGELPALLDPRLFSHPILVGLDQVPGTTFPPLIARHRKGGLKGGGDNHVAVRQQTLPQITDQPDPHPRVKPEPPNQRTVLPAQLPRPEVTLQQVSPTKGAPLQSEGSRMDDRDGVPPSMQPIGVFVDNLESTRRSGQKHRQDKGDAQGSSICHTHGDISSTDQLLRPFGKDRGGDEPSQHPWVGPVSQRLSVMGEARGPSPSLLPGKSGADVQSGEQRFPQDLRLFPHCREPRLDGREGRQCQGQPLLDLPPVPH